MNEKRIRLFISWRFCLVVALFLLGIPIIWLGAQAPSRVEVLSHLVREGLDRWHYSGKKIDSQLSRNVMEEYIQFLDFGKRYLYTEDVERISALGGELARALQSGKLEFVNQAVDLVQKRMDEVWRYIDPLMATPQSLESDESLEMDPEKRTFFKNEEEMRLYWSRYIRQRILLRMYDFWLEEKEKDKDPQKKQPKIDLAGLERKAREDVRNVLGTYFRRVREIQDEDRLGRFFNALLTVFDPHSSYFAPRDEEDFNIEMSGSFEGIGALLGEKEDYIQIMQIIVGGPSWRDQRLEVGDKILKVGQGKEEPVDVAGIRVTDAVKLIRGKKGTWITLIVRKPDGRIEKIELQRDIVVVEESFAKAALFSDPLNQNRFGYIYLPSFYNDFSGKTQRNAADDVRKAVKDLESAGMSGLVLDLRGNGGGSLDDAIRISGLFIDQGPVLQVKDREQGVKVYTDPEPGNIYDGPLIVMIDAVSASASEIVAAALQDYRRALVIGGRQSFGKGTVQVMLDLDGFVETNHSAIKPLGAVKLTVQTFYRVSGDTNQFKGVVPDIVLPASNDYLKVGERYYDYPIKPQVIESARYEPIRRTFDPEEIRRMSEKRVAASKYFDQIRRYIDILEKRELNSVVSLDWATFLADQETERKVIESFEIPDQQVRYSVNAVGLSPAGDGDRLARDRKASIDSWIKELRRDAYIEESLLVLNDILSMEGGANR